MPRQLLFFFFSCSSLLRLVGSTVYKSGVQHDVLISSLAAAGCVPCHESPYGSNLKSQDMMSCTGPYFFFGNQKLNEKVLEIGALASVEVLRTDASRSAPYLSNGVYWHFRKGCSFGFTAVDSNVDSIKESSGRSLSQTNHGISWIMDHSVGCTSLDDLKTNELVDTSKWRKHIFNCPENPASALLSELQQEEGRGVRAEMNAIHLSSQPCNGRQATLYTKQEFAMFPAPAITLLQTAVTSLVKKILNDSDLVMDWEKSWKVDNSIYMDYTVELKGSKTGSSSALVRLNASIDDNTFSSALSAAMGTPVTVKGSYQRYVSETPQDNMRDPRTANANMLWFAIVPLLIASVVGYQCYKHVLNVALEQEQARARARELGVRAVVHTSPSGFIITSSTSQLPSAEASLVSPGSANNYEMATAVVTSKPM